MGLDIFAYGNVKKLDCVFDEWGEPIDPKTREPMDGVMARHNEHYPERASPIEEAFYSYDESSHVRCGAYSRYNRWRDELAKAAGWHLGSYEQYGRSWPSYAASAWVADGGPFWELINFSDCEGVIGTDACKKLLAEFEAMENPPPEDTGFNIFEEMKAALRIASNDGFLRFS